MRAISWGAWDEQADACVTTERGNGLPLWLVPINSPLTLSIQKGLALPASLDGNPKEGNELLDQMVSDVARDVERAATSGADGIFYVLDGAYPAHSTPMQYGGYFLERDRELLELANDFRFNIVFVEGTDEVYLDTVSDLPAHAFGWRMKETGFTPEMMKPNRPGPYASFDGMSDIQIRTQQEACA